MPTAPKSPAKPADEDKKTLSDASVADRINPFQSTPGGTGTTVAPDHLSETIDSTTALGDNSPVRNPDVESGDKDPEPAAED